MHPPSRPAPAPRGEVSCQRGCSPAAHSLEEPRKVPNAFFWSSLCSAGALLTPKQQLPRDFLGTEREVGLGLTVSPSLLCLGSGFTKCATTTE